MPEPTTTDAPASGRSQYSDPSARARHASLVRWGKERPMSFQERLAAIRARRKAKKGGGKGRKPAKTPEQRKAEREAQRQKVYTDTAAALEKAGAIDQRSLGTLSEFASGNDMDPKRADALEKAGLVERGKDGTLRMTSAGNAVLSAAERGDVRGAQDALSRGRDKTVTAAEREKAKGERAMEKFRAASAREFQRNARQQEREQLKQERQKAALERAKQKKAGRGAKRERISQAEQDRRAGVTDDTPPKPTSDGTLTPKERSAPDAPKPTPERTKPTPVDLADAERAGEAAARGARRRSRRHQRRRMSTIVREAETKMSDRWDRIDALKAQTAQERAMFANMGRSKGGGGAGPGGKPTGGQGGLWPKGKDGKRHPEGGGGGGTEAPKHDLSTHEGRTAATMEKAGMTLNVLPHHDEMASEYEGGRANVVSRLSKLSKEDLDTLSKDTHEKWSSVSKGPSRDALDRASKQEFKRANEYQQGLIKEARQQQNETPHDTARRAKAEYDKINQQQSEAYGRHLEANNRAATAKTPQEKHAAQTEANQHWDTYTSLIGQHSQRQQELLRTMEQSGYRLGGQRGEKLVSLRKEKGVPAPRQGFNPSGYKKDLDMLDLDTTIDTLEDATEALLTDAEAEVKAGRRNSGADQEKIQQVFELANELEEIAIALGADPGDDDDSDVADEEEPDDEAEMEGKAVAKREDVSAADKQRAVSDYGDVDYADEKNKKYPIDTEEHIRAAWNYINKAKNAGMYGDGGVETIKRKIIAAWKKKIDPAGPPSAAETKKSLDIETVYGSEIKALDNDRIGGFGVLFGTAETPDLSAQQDFFTKATDYWLDKFGWPRPITYHHGMDEDTRDDPIIGSWTKAVVKDEGIWLEGQLNKAYRYYGAIKELVRRGALKLSSDSAPQWVIRERQPNGANEVKRWPLITASTTVTPAEPRMSGLSFKSLLAELGLENIQDDSEASDADDTQSADGRKAIEDRARKLSLELELLSLETTT